MSNLGRNMQRAHLAEQRRNAHQRRILADRIVQVALEQRRFIQITGRRDRALMDELRLLTDGIIRLGATTGDLHQIGQRVNDTIRREGT